MQVICDGDPIEDAVAAAVPSRRLSPRLPPFFLLLCGCVIELYGIILTRNPLVQFKEFMFQREAIANDLRPKRATSKRYIIRASQLRTWFVGRRTASPLVAEGDVDQYDGSR